MAKKVLILSSSPRRGGNSDTLCDEFMRGAAESNHEVEKIFLRDKTIHTVRDAVHAVCTRSHALKKTTRQKSSKKWWMPM